MLISPLLPAVDAAVLRTIPPESGLPAVDMIKSPLVAVPVPPAPVVIKTSPPAVAPPAALPAVIVSALPAFVPPEDPTVIEIGPPTPPVVTAPVPIRIDPESPAAAAPVLRIAVPVAPLLADVINRSAPDLLEETVAEPLSIDIIPPVLEADEVVPADKVIEPPTPLFPDPTVKNIEPPRPEVAVPEPMYTAPLFPDVA
jgi:hypothetical protein